MKKYALFFMSSLICSTIISSPVIAFDYTENDVTTAYESATEGNRRLSDPEIKCELIESLSRDGTAIWSQEYHSFIAGRPGPNDPSSGSTIEDHGGLQIALKAEKVKQIKITADKILYELPGADFSDEKTTYTVDHKWRLFTPVVREEHNYAWHFLYSGLYHDRFGTDFIVRTIDQGNSYLFIVSRIDSQIFDAYVHFQINTEAEAATKTVNYSPGVGELFSSNVSVYCV